MKNYKLIAMAVCFYTANLIAQTADQYVTNGLASLSAKDLAGAYSNFNAAVSLASTNSTANALLAVTRLLVLPQQPTGSNFLNSLGFSKSGRNIYNWTSNVPVDANGNSILPNVNTSVGIALYKSTVIPALGASRTNLARVTDPAFTLALTPDETDGQAVTLDYGDVLLMQAELLAAEFLGYTLNAHNCNFVFSQIQNFGNPGGLTLQALLANYPSLLTQNSLQDLANSKVALTNAIALYQAASEFIRNTRPPGQGLFVLGSEQQTEEAEFRTALTNVLLSLNGPVQFNPGNEPFSLDISNYFSGAKSLRSLVPKFNGDSYVNNTLPDYTFGGVLQGELPCDTEKFLRHTLGFNRGGVYIGDNGLSDNFGYLGGSFAVFVSTNGQATLVGYDQGDGIPNDGTSFGVFFQFNLDRDGNFNFTNHSINGYGSVGSDGSFNGQLDDLTNGFSVYLNGNQQSPSGPFRNGAGYYTGSFTGTDSGNLSAVLGTDGELIFSSFQGGVVQDGGSGQIDSGNNFIGQTDGGTSLTGTYNPATFVISGTYTNPPQPISDGGHGTFRLALFSRVPIDSPPVITADLPSNSSAPLGNKVTLSIGAAGSAPLCYQWYLNGSVITNATTNPLVLSNVQYADAGNYSVTIENVVGQTNSAVENLNVTPENVPPSIQITSPTPGQQWSNALFTVTGKAADNVAVSNVLVQVNSSGWNPVDTFNGTNWSAQAALIPGPNTIRAYSIDTSGNVSVTNKVSFNYVVSAVLTVQVSGKGTVSPNYSNALLAIGTTNTMAAIAMPGSGFAFTNWTGGTSFPLVFLTSLPALKFVMASNLVLQANFVDVQAPTVVITTPVPGMNVSNASYTVTGKAADNLAVSNVWVQLNNGGWNPVDTFNGSNWTALVNLTPGTNTVQALAVDTTGNRSMTNTVKFFYVVNSTLTVAINGQGSINPPNYTNALLSIGRNYSVSATAKPGFGFTNWTDCLGSLVTNKAAFQFLMTSNLCLAVNFVDVQAPTVVITTPTPGMNVSNASYTVTGKAADNLAVSNVWVQLNNGGWNPVDTFNGSNWTAQVNLTPGTNTVQALAVDTTGNRSMTNTVKFFYVVNSTLTVAINGQGSINPPNYTNALLSIGRNYSVSATAKPGFGFTNWTDCLGSLVTNKAAFQFLMTSNLCLAVNFVDVQAPTVVITTPVPGMNVSNASYTVTGKAADNLAVSNVWVQLNNGGWNPVDTFNGSNWTALVNLTPGTNTVQALAVDTTGNRSMTNTVKFFYVVNSTLTVAINGQGSINPPNYTNALLSIGRNYSVSATAKPGFGFTNWTDCLGSLVTNKAAFQFLMTSNLCLAVNFVDVQAPTVVITTPTPGMNVSNASYTVTGKAADNLAVSNVWVQLNNGGWNPVDTFNGSNWTAQVNLTPGTNTVQALAVDTTGNRSMTNTVKFFYVVNSTLTVAINGQGSISPPNYTNALLSIGRNYAVSATAKPGFGFYYWSGGVTMSTNPILNFIMSSNLMITANFRDVTPPAVTLTSPVGSESVLTNEIIVVGKATDNVAVSNVLVQLNNTGWNPATTFDGTNWTANISLIAGTNLVQVQAVDTSGLASKVVNLTIVRGLVPTVFTIYQNFAFHNPQAQIAFDGNDYLVAFQAEDSGSGIPSAQLVSRSGALASPLLQIPVVGGADPPKVTFDGNNYLMAWSDPENQIEGPGIHGQFIDTAGLAIGSRFLINQSTTVDNFTTMVFGGGVHFMSWADSRNQNITGYDDIYGAMVAPDGTLVASDFEINAAGIQDQVGQGTAGFDGTNFLATWGGAAGHFSVNGRLISPAGNFITDTFNIYTNSSLPAGRALNCVAFDGTKYLVLFTIGAGSGSASTWQIQGRFVTTGGQVLTNKISITTDAGPQIVPCATFDGTHYLITWNQGWNPFIVGTSGSIKARFFDINGNPTAPEFTLFSPAAGQTALWAPVLFDGTQYFSVGGLGHQLPPQDITFTNGIIKGATFSP